MALTIANSILPPKVLLLSPYLELRVEQDDTLNPFLVYFDWPLTCILTRYIKKNMSSTGSLYLFASINGSAQHRRWPDLLIS